MNDAELPQERTDMNLRLFVAARFGYIDNVRHLLAAGAGAHAQDVLGTTALMHASASGHYVIVDLLLTAGANIEAKNVLGQTALMYACGGGYNNIGDVLRAAGATADATDYGGMTALVYASKCVHLDIVNVVCALLRGGARLNDYLIGLRAYDEAVRDLGGADGVRAAHRAWLEALDDTSVAKQRWLASQPGRYTKAAR
jgi:ankyrin repeat protein